MNSVKTMMGKWVVELHGQSSPNCTKTVTHFVPSLRTRAEAERYAIGLLLSEEEYAGFDVRVEKFNSKKYKDCFKYQRRYS